MDWKQADRDGLPESGEGVYALYFAVTQTFGVGEFLPDTGWFYPHDAADEVVFTRQPSHYALLERPDADQK